MSAIDWIIIFLLMPLLVVPALRRRGSRAETATDRFAAGRSLPWFVLGGSMAATSLSTDTPLLISGAFYRDGLAGNWFWLVGAPGTLATFFFFCLLYTSRCV